MAAIRYTSFNLLQAAIVALDASAETFLFTSPQLFADKLNVPPVGKQVAWIEAGSNNMITVFTTSGSLAGMQSIDIKGNQFMMFTGTATPTPVYGKPVVVLNHQSPKALEDYLKTIDATATVTVYADESQVVQTGAIYRIICNRGRITIIRGSTLGAVLFIMDKGAEYVTVKK